MSTADVIKCAILRCPGVKDAEIFDDPEDGAIGTFAALVVGGNEADVRKAIADHKAAGIASLVRVVPAHGPGGPGVRREPRRWH